MNRLVISPQTHSLFQRKHFCVNKTTKPLQQTGFRLLVKFSICIAQRGELEMAQ